MFAEIEIEMLRLKLEVNVNLKLVSLINETNILIKTNQLTIVNVHFLKVLQFGKLVVHEFTFQLD